MSQNIQVSRRRLRTPPSIPPLMFSLVLDVHKYSNLYPPSRFRRSPSASESFPQFLSFRRFLCRSLKQCMTPSYRLLGVQSTPLRPRPLYLFNVFLFSGFARKPTKTPPGPGFHGSELPPPFFNSGNTSKRPINGRRTACHESRGSPPDLPGHLQRLLSAPFSERRLF